MNRKEFLSMLGFSAGTLTIAACMGGCSKEGGSVAAPNVDFTLDLSQSANAALNTNGGYIYSNGVIVAKTTSGAIIAVSASCTHEGTSVQYQSNNNRFYCPNHGATFSNSGSVTQGPANIALKQYNVTVTGNIVQVKG
ncbi:MAG: Rieske (2Fe-2S) protein [Flavobacterium sp.]|nr:Rieske (2Fe-2S) protein [Flavobacterium sp.]